MIHPTPLESAYITAAALAVGAKPDDLNALISFESNYNPQARNPYSSAAGLLQFIDSTSRELGFLSTQDLINKNPTFSSQIKNAVIPYLKKYMPYPSQQSLYMAVFYPAARNWPEDRQFPLNVQAVNPGIKTPRDYINKVNQRKLLPLIVPFSIILILSILYLITRRQKDESQKSA